MREFEIKPELERILKKLFKKDKNLYEQIMKKIEEVVESYDVEHYKNLRYNMKESKRVHIGHFVLIFNYDKKSDFVSFEYFDNHNNIYKRN
ncbi:MAG TPA: addiction module toxin RelE [Candidatus Nanoarchaeia archaeon]|nr:addiction module toxin RelE [Candidatus Nanoarchaeia archaeon]